MTVTAVKGQHSPDPNFLPVLGEVHGYWLEFRRRRFLSDGRRRSGRAPKSPTLFVPHIGGVGAQGSLGPVRMGWTHALAFAQEVMPRVILPIHHSTFSLYREPIELFVNAARASSLKVERLSEGQEVRLD